jgi:hypothetical protein
VYVNVSVYRLSMHNCTISNVFFLCMSMSVSLDCPFLIVTSLAYLLVHGNISVSRLSIHDYTISNVFVLVYVNVILSGFLIPDCSISNLVFLFMSMSVSVDSQGMIVLSLRSNSCVCECQCLWIAHS